MSGVENLLSRLDKVKPTGRDRWKACCPAHKSSKQSLAIAYTDGKVLVHCFAEGCSIHDVLGAVGLTTSDLMPECAGESKPIKKPFYASDVLQISRDEILVAYLIVKKMIEGAVNFNDSQRLLKCASRLRHACDVANDGNGVPMKEAARVSRNNERILHGKE